jgi:hypothetical protein
VLAVPLLVRPPVPGLVDLSDLAGEADGVAKIVLMSVQERQGLTHDISDSVVGPEHPPEPLALLVDQVQPGGAQRAMGGRVAVVRTDAGTPSYQTWSLNILSGAAPDARKLSLEVSAEITIPRQSRELSIAAPQRGLIWRRTATICPPARGSHRSACRLAADKGPERRSAFILRLSAALAGSAGTGPFR